MLRLEALPLAFTYRGTIEVTETRRSAFLLQLSFAWRLCFRRYDGCQTSVASCEDVHGVEVCGYGFGSGSAALAEYYNFALDLHFGSAPPQLATKSLSLSTLWESCGYLEESWRVLVKHDNSGFKCCMKEGDGVWNGSLVLFFFKGFILIVLQPKTSFLFMPFLLSHFLLS